MVAPDGDALDVVGAIVAKRDGRELGAAQIHELIGGFVSGTVPDYQLAALLMAGYLRGFSDAEAVALTDAFIESGERLDVSGLRGPTVDKHSTGGVADATTLIVAPVVAELGLQILKLSGRGLGHTGGTLDKLESIPGMRTSLGGRELLEQVDRIGLAVGAQTADLVPADRAVYALRDVTATVGDVALIASSIMSKKLAGGAASIVVDVKVGSGAFAKDAGTAERLAGLCVSIGTAAGRATAAVLSDMSQPLGDEVGNAIEVAEAIAVLRGERTGRLRAVSIELAGRLATLGGVASDAETGRRAAERVLSSGAALDRFARFVEAQGGDPGVVGDAGLLPRAPVVREVLAGRSGWLAGVDGEAVGMAAAHLGAGRRRKQDDVDPAVGIELPVKIGDEVTAGGLLARVLARNDTGAERAEVELRAALAWSETPVAAPALIIGTVDAAPGPPAEQQPPPPFSE